MWRALALQAVRGMAAASTHTMGRHSAHMGRALAGMSATRVAAGLAAGMQWHGRSLSTAAEMSMHDKAGRYEDLIHRYVEGRNINKVFSLLNEMRLEGLRVSKGACNRVIDLVSRERMMNRVFEMFEIMRVNGVPIDVVHYNMAIGACLHTDNLSHALSLLREMHNAGIELTPRTYSSFITAYGKLGNLDKARNYLEEAENNHAANEYVYYSLMTTLERNNDAEGVYGVFNRMVQRGIPPTVQCFNVLLSLCVRNNALDKAVDVMRQMAAVGVTPDRLSRSLLMNGLAASGHYDELCDVVRSMAEDHMEPMTKALSRVVGHFTQDDTRTTELSQFLAVVPDEWYRPPRRYALNAAVSKLMNAELKGLAAEGVDAVAVVQRVFRELNRHGLVLPQTALLYDRWGTERDAALATGPSMEVLASIAASKAAAAAEAEAMADVLVVDSVDTESGSDSDNVSDTDGDISSSSSSGSSSGDGASDGDESGNVSESGYAPSSDTSAGEWSSSSSSSDSSDSSSDSE